MFMLTFCVALFLEASTFALNDYYDLEIDRRNKRMDRPLVRGDVSPRFAVRLAAVFFPLGLLAAYFVNFPCFLIAVVTAAFALVYDVVLKRLKVVGNFFIAYVMAIPFVFGGVAVIPAGGGIGALKPAILMVALIAFLAGAGREVMKDVQDYEGDRAMGVRSFPQVPWPARGGCARRMFLPRRRLPEFPTVPHARCLTSIMGTMSISVSADHRLLVPGVSWQLLRGGRRISRGCGSSRFSRCSSASSWFLIGVFVG